jgi:hypothetical protein
LSGVDYFSGGVITIIGFLELGLVALWIAVGSGRQRRSHFWVRLVLASLAVPSLVEAVIGISRLNVLSDEASKTLFTFLLFLGVIALMLVPSLLYRPSGSPPSPPESDGGGGGGPEQPPRSPSPPRGGVPLPNAEQARVRARDHAPPRFAELTRRRSAREPGRKPARTKT